MAEDRKQKVEKELIAIVKNKGGKLLTPYIDGNNEVTIECASGHKFNELFLHLRSGRWCELCSVPNAILYLSKFLEDGDIIYEKPFEKSNLKFDLGITMKSDITVIDYDSRGLFLSSDRDEKVDAKIEKERKEVIDKVKKANEVGFKVVILDQSLNSQEEKAKEYFAKILVNKQKVLTSNAGSHNWLTSVINKAGDGDDKEDCELKEEDKICEKFDKSIKSLAPALGIKIQAEKPKAILIYIRVSTRKQVRYGVSLEAQEKHIRDYAAKIDVGIRGKPYEDAGISGKKIENRPGIKQALNDIQRGEELVTFSASRLSRSAEEALYIVRTLKEKGAAVRCLDIDGNMNENNTYLYFAIKSVLAEHEVRITSERVKSSMNFAIVHRGMKTKPPYGMKSAGKGKGHIEDPEEQKNIQLIRQLSKDPEMTVAKIVAHLDKLGIKGRQDGKFRHPLVTSIMKNYNIVLEKDKNNSNNSKEKDSKEPNEQRKSSKTGYIV